MREEKVRGEVREKMREREKRGRKCEIWVPHIAFLGTETVQRESANGNDNDNAEERERLFARLVHRPSVR